MMRDFLDLSRLPAGSLGRVFVDTAETKALFRAFDGLLAEPATATNGKGVTVLGPARSGKTVLVQEYLRRCQSGDVKDREGDGFVRKPVRFVHVQLQPSTRLNTIPGQTLEALNHPAPYHGHPQVQTSRVVQEILSSGCELVVFDEIHHLMASDTKRVRDSGSHWLSYILDQTLCPMILIGYTGFREVLAENTFLGGRLVPTEPLRPYTIHEPDSLAMFRLVLEDMEGELGLPVPSDLSALDTAKRILVTCGGKLGLLENFLTAARDIARGQGANCLHRAVLGQAAERLKGTWRDIPSNPFELDDLDKALTAAERSRSPGRRGRHTEDE